jgi:hypothetical protein
LLKKITRRPVSVLFIVILESGTAAEAVDAAKSTEAANPSEHVRIFMMASMRTRSPIGKTQFDRLFLSVGRRKSRVVLSLALNRAANLASSP